MMFSHLLTTLSAEDASGGGIAWWVWVILIVILLVLLWFWFGREDEEAHPTETPVGHKVETMEAAVVPQKSETPLEPDDLKKIEGIGPKVASLLNEAGIFTFAQLAGTEPQKLDAILDAAKLQMMDPTTWADQARLAAAGDWENLDQLQDELKGGKRA